MAPPPTDPRSDQQLIDAINRADAAAFDALYHRYRDWVVNLAYRFTHDREMALDVMQEVFVYLLRKFPGFDLTAKMTTFLYPVVRHICVAHAQRARRHVTSPDLLAVAPCDENSTDSDPRQELAAVMSNLSDGHREVLLLRFVDDLSLEEIADAMGIPLGTVKSRIHHALKTLREDPRAKKYFQQ